MSRFDQDNGGTVEKSSLGSFVQEWLQRRTFCRDQRTPHDGQTSTNLSAAQGAAPF